MNFLLNNNKDNEFYLENIIEKVSQIIRYWSHLEASKCCIYFGSGLRSGSNVLSESELILF